MSLFRLPIWSPRLLWKLAGSYLVITLTVVTIYIFIDAELNYRDFQKGLNAASIASRAHIEASRFAPFLNRTEPNLPAAEQLLFRLKHEFEDRQTGLYKSYYFSISEFTPEVLSLSLWDQRGTEIVNTGKPLDEVSKKLLVQMLNTTLPNELRERVLLEADGIRLVAAPFTLQSPPSQNLLVVRLHLPLRWWDGVLLTSLIGDLRVLDLFYIALMAFVFGYIIARQLTKRLERISTATQAWGRGDFAVLSEDSSADEIGELSRRLNRMAEELREVFALRQNLTASEERNRLARDLHDTVKQRTFALSMQIGATQALLPEDPRAAQTRLTEAEKLAHQIQHELVTIIEELRPGVIQSLTANLRETINDWSRQNGIQTELQMDHVPSFKATTQAELLRILQEALSNIARHSNAKNVVVQISSADNTHVNLWIRDDGRGFNPSQKNEGMGLQNMRERAEALPGGKFSITSSAHTGTEILVRCTNI
jgi:two-component system, NarL family, sensor histidine kinase LiaS